MESNGVRVDLRLKLGDENINSEQSLERALQLKPFIWVEEEGKEPWVSAIESNEI